MFDFQFNWSSEFNTNIELIDTHHQQLFKIGRDIEQLLQIKCIGVTDKQLLDIICELRDFSGYHFYEEERLMEEYHYPDIVNHRKLHLAFSEKIAGVRLPDLKANPVIELEKIRNEVQDNLFEHILKADKQMADYILEKKNRVVTASNPSPKEDPFEKIYGKKICALDMTKVYLYYDQTHKGHTVLIHKEDAKDISRLSVLERNLFFADVARVAKAIKTIYGPQAFNYASYCDMETQLHMHIVPKYKEQEDWGKPFLLEDSKQLPLQTEYESILEALRTGLR